MAKKLTEREALEKEIVAAVEAEAEIKKLSEFVSGVKERVRAHADRYSDPEKNIFTLDTKAGPCKVVFVSDKFALTSAADSDVLKAKLDEPVWLTLFEMQAVLRDTAEAGYKLLSDEDKKKLEGFVEWKKQSPRVTLPKVSQ